LPSRITSVTTATRLNVILLKSMYALRIGELIGMVFSRISTIFMVLGLCSDVDDEAMILGRRARRQCCFFRL
jgi:hypothetical protein